MEFRKKIYGIRELKKKSKLKKIFNNSFINAKKFNNLF